MGLSPMHQVSWNTPAGDKQVNTNEVQPASTSNWSPRGELNSPVVGFEGLVRPSGGGNFLTAGYHPAHKS
jgi:hypothetical protein